MDHKSETSIRGGKNALQKLFGDLKIEIKVKGYKSSEGDKTFDPPSEQKRQPE